MRFTTVLVCSSPPNGTKGGFVWNFSSRSVEKARHIVHCVTDGMKNDGFIGKDEAIYGITFAGKTLKDIEVECPHWFSDATKDLRE